MRAYEIEKSNVDGETYGLVYETESMTVLLVLRVDEHWLPRGTINEFGEMTPLPHCFTMMEQDVAELDAALKDHEARVPGS